MKVAVIGGGAAGFFAAITAKENHPDAEVKIFEKSPKLLSKVKVSGGGRCNVCNGTLSINELSKAYPRGGKKLKKAFQEFNSKHSMEWFEKRGVPLTIQEDMCVFPISQDSQSIIDCFLNQCKKLGVNIAVSQGIHRLEQIDEKWRLHFIKDEHDSEIFDKVIVATGGSPKRKGLEWLEELGHKIEDPVPSLFTFNMPDEDIKELMGVVVKETITSIQGSKLKGDGPLLITHWGMSGPAILKLSSFGARILNEKDYQFKIQVNWVNIYDDRSVMKELEEIKNDHPKKKLANFRPYKLPERLWHYILRKSNLNPDKIWGELGKKALNKLTNVLTVDTYTVSGKTTFKEEFVTCGGISLESINFKTMESRICPGLYFAGEVMDIDGITGGYNFQSAWTTGFIAGHLRNSGNA